MAIARLLGGEAARLFLADRPPAPHRPAAVLVPILDHPGAPTVLLTRRAHYLPHHPGQISFPGGRVEAQDASPQAAALREAAEETALDPARVEVVGRLDDYITVTGFRVAPFVGVVTPPVTLRPDPAEVDSLFEVPLAFLMDEANHQHGVREKDGKYRPYFAIPYGDYYIWGATAGILINLHAVLDGNPGAVPQTPA
ncbi:CoA pyrophosphatase [Roseospira goensis]|uniref:8-oxo-dGTP pyrophosphatase MutT (NUDIX family) n=1 Tax=Roseospira goensis TaxID=391922 RepID=A0A7W6RZ60_9PROT|nr:CoA pyrophosphatase [Roseospira goensis]MBB4285237.1 8-oxo-dGTP pyrophosphatase MutT (NUDIX family) [Roseospira goensis]